MISAMWKGASTPGPSKSQNNASYSDFDDSDDTDSSSDVTEDEEGTELTPALDAAILRTLSKIKRKEGVYGDVNVLEEELKEAEARAGKLGLNRVLVNKAKEKPYRLADYHRETLLNSQDPTIANPSNTHAYSESTPDQPLTHVQSERLLRQEALSAFQQFGADEDDDDEGGLVLKQGKGEDGEKGDEEEYRKFLLEMGGGEEEVRKVLGLGDEDYSGHREDSEDEADGVKGEEVKVEVKVVDEQTLAKRKAKKAKADEDFLMDYILNRGWIDRSEDHVPTYDEIVGKPRKDDEDENKGESSNGPMSSHPWGTLEDEDEFDDKAEEFETAYNFRFEEPGAATIPTHPRVIPTLVRRPDDKRKTKRALKAERKAAEKAAHEEEMRKQKGAKRREMEKRMQSLRRDLGEEGIDWNELERVMEGDWDEREWERVVGRMLEAKAEAEDDEKPSWDDDLDDIAYEDDDDAELHVPYGNGAEAAEEEFDDAPINMDADFMNEPSGSKKKRKKNKGKARAEEPEVNEEGLTIAEKAEKVKEAMDEYNKLDHEDMIGDLPTKFKYTTSAPSSFGLTPVEILLATDAELNQLVSVKHLAPYRSGGLGVTGQGLGKRVRELKENLKKRRWGEDVGGGSSRIERNGHATGQGLGQKGGEARKTKRLGKKQRARLAAQGGAVGEGLVRVESAGSVNDVVEGGVGNGDASEGKKKRKKRKKSAVE